MMITQSLLQCERCSVLLVDQNSKVYMTLWTINCEQLLLTTMRHTEKKSIYKFKPSFTEVFFNFISELILSGI